MRGVVVIAASCEKIDGRKGNIMDTPNQLTTDSLMSVLAEAQQTVRSYDTKAQIIGVGYIFALGVVMQSGNHIPIPVQFAALYVLAGWAIIVLPIIMFALVLHPSRVDKVKFDQVPDDTQSMMYYDDRKFADATQYRRSVTDTDWYLEISTEIMKVSKVRDVKRTRFLRALYWSGGSFAILFLSQMLRASGVLAQ